MKQARAAVVVGIGAVAYLSAVTQRSSMGAASVVATERFHTTAEQLASLAVWQILVYAAVQIPVGVLLDRFGPRKTLAFGAITMAIGQIVVAFSLELTPAIFGRMLVGLGDAFTFISMIRLINGWYQGHKAALLQQWLGNLGQLGQVMSAIPFALLLRMSNWQVAFTTVASLSLLIGLITLALVRDDRLQQSTVAKSINIRNVQVQLREAVRNPGVRLAFWTHFTTQSSGTVFVLLWGLPFLVKAQGLDHDFASGLLSGFVFIGLATGTVYGWICSRRPHWRNRLTTLLVVILLLAWMVVLLQPTSSPAWLLFVLILAMGAAGPASMIAFDFSREYVDRDKLGTANGFINIGGFIASFTMMYLVGVILDFHHFLSQQSGSMEPLYGLRGFRIALSVQLFVIGLGLAFKLIEARKVRLSVAKRSVPV